MGVGLTLLVVLLDQLGVLQPLERWLYDRRARDCQFFTPPPTDQIVQLDVNDNTLEAVGTWPWKRSVLADVIDEVGRAGAKVIALDMIFPEYQDPDLIRDENGDLKKIDHDANLAETFRRHNNVLIAISFDLEQKQIKETDGVKMIKKAIRHYLADDLEMTAEDLAQCIAAENFVDEENVLEIVNNHIFEIRREEFYNRAYHLIDEKDLPFDQLCLELLPKTAIPVTESLQLDVLRKQFEKIVSLRTLRRDARPMEKDSPPLALAKVHLPPIPMLAEASASSGFVNPIKHADGVVREMPLWVNHQGWVYPQMGLALATAFLDVPIQNLQIESNRVVIPKSDGTRIDIPTYSRYVDRDKHDISAVIQIPWFGETDEWETMFDYPEYKDETKQHMSVHQVWQVTEMRRKIRNNNIAIHEALEYVLFKSDPTKFKKYTENLIPINDTESRRPLIKSALADLEESGWTKIFEECDYRDLDETEKRMWRSMQALQEADNQVKKLKRDLGREENELIKKLRGKVVLIGWTATGVIADWVSTSIHPKAPGVIAHAVIFNAIITGEFWRNMPVWVTVVFTLGLGLSMTIMVAIVGPVQAVVSALLLVCGYLVLNGIVLFDYGNMVVGASAPLVSVVVVWSICTVYRFVSERSERQRITRRFQRYVDPVLVNYVIEHPEQVRLDGQVREMTVVFTDLAGFTTLSEQLKGKTVAMLNEYMGLMVPIIRQRHGYVNKFLGDGIMFFFGAPEQTTLHATDAIATILEMQEGLSKFNIKLADQDLPQMTMRAGVSTGMMVVGDAGSDDASDYTVLGDTVNLGARLEAANKMMDTKALVTERTLELIGDNLFLFRPVGRLIVVGKTEPSMTFEPLSLTNRATDEQERLVELTIPVVKTFQGARFKDCLVAIEQLEKTFKEDKFTALYRELCQKYLANPPVDTFNGHIKMVEK